MTYIPHRQIPSARSETEPNFGEVGDNDEFNDLLQGMDELISAEGGVSASDFIRRTFEEMEKEELDFNELRIAAVINLGIGTRAEAVERIAGLTAEEFHLKYPGSVGEAILWYIAPVLDEAL